MPTARELIVEAYRDGNKLSPGEALSGDDVDYGFSKLNLIADDLSARQEFLYKSILTSAAVTGNITLGTGSWSAINPSNEIYSVTCNDLPISPITMSQYNSIYQKTQTGLPQVYCYDGYDTIYLYEVATGQTISIETRVGVQAFSDTETNYALPNGFKRMLIARLAVMVYPGEKPQYLLDAEKKANFLVGNLYPAVLNVRRYTTGGFTGYRPNIINGAT